MNFGNVVTEIPTQIRGVPKIGGVLERKKRIGATKLPKLYGRGERRF